MPSYNTPIHRPNAKNCPKRPKNRLRTREYPPIDSCKGDKACWIRLNESPNYRRRVKKAVEMVKTYRLMATKGERDYLDRADVDAIHGLLDQFTFKSNRRDSSTHSNESFNPNADTVPTTSLNY